MKTRLNIETSFFRFGRVLPVCLLFVALFFASPEVAFSQEQEEQQEEESHETSRFSDEPIPLVTVPPRPRPIFELGEPFLGTGTLGQGIKLPTGAVWQPAFMAFGSIRTAAQAINNDVTDTQISEGVARFDLFGNLYLTQTERIVIGFRPLDQDGRFTRYTLSADPADSTDFQDELNFKVRTLFFEGDIGEIFPKLDWTDKHGFDIGFSVGRQPLSFQDGLLMNESAIDAVGLTRANLKWFGAVNMRITALFGWGEIDRPMGGFNGADSNAKLFGLFTETDTPTQTIELDLIYVSGDSLSGDGLYGGFSSIRRFGGMNNTFRVVASFPVGDEGLSNSQGVLFHNQLGWTPHHSINYVYINTFLGIDEFRSAARGPSTGGPLGQTGILFAAVGLGRYGAALGNFADKSVGGAIGYQMFFAHTRRQLVLEAGARYVYDRDVMAPVNAAAGGARYQIAFGRRGVIVLDGFGSYNFEVSKAVFGGRLELLIKL